MEAIKKAGVAKGFDRILQILVVIVFMATAAYVVVQQAQYQAGSREITRERNTQLDKIIYSQEQVKTSATELKDFIGCLKALPNPPTDEGIEQCRVSTERK